MLNPTPSNVFSYMSTSVEPAALPKHARIGVSSLGNFFMTEIARSLQHAFARLGVDARLFTERDDLDELRKDDTVIVVAPHEFFQLGEGTKAFKLLRRLPSLIMLNTEQPQTQWFAVAQQYLKAASTVLDINYESVRYLANSGYTALFLPLGYCNYVVNTYDGRELPEHALFKHMRRSKVGPLPSSYSDRPIDVLFIGTASPRRQAFFVANARFFSSINTLIYMPDSNAPLRTEEARTVDFSTFVALVKRSKILLNIHRDDSPYLEWHRIVTLGIMQRTLVVSDHCQRGPCVEPNLDYLDGPLEAVPQLCQLALSNDGTAEFIADRAYLKLKINYPMEQIIGRCWTTLAKSKGGIK